MENLELTLLSEGQIWGNRKENQLEVIRNYGTKAAVTDLCVLTGAFLYEDNNYNIAEDKSLTGRTSWFWTKSKGWKGVCIVDKDGYKLSNNSSLRTGAIRPVLQSSDLYAKLYPNRRKGYKETEEVEYGEYPQWAADSRMQNILESEYNIGLNKTGRSYTFDFVKSYYSNTGFRPLTYEEYEYQGKKYIRIRVNTAFRVNVIELSNGVEYKNEDYVWVEVSPVKWLIDDKSGLLISKRGLVSGIRFLNESNNYKGDFDRTEMKNYLDEYMLRDLTQSANLTNVQNVAQDEIIAEDQQLEEEQEIEEVKQNLKVSNPYGFNFEMTSEEDIIRGAVESGVAVFLHGPSSEGKSARVKQIDPTCEVIYLQNSTPESLNGKSVYNAQTGEMIDIKPTWLKKVEAKCENEPEKLHIVFFEELTNALPSIQSMAFNIVLDKEVNGIWKLPDNARIVAAGNEMKDSISANQLSEPLFNRFAHVYIKTTTESWLKWASENNIHPAIYSYIAYKKGETLRSKYDGEKPNADPRKWEMASKMLYASGRPEMLRALVGEDITREFVEFCSLPVITLEDVINGNYSKEDIEALNTAERHVTTMGLSQVDEENLEVVREFITELGAEYKAIFDALWTHGEENRLEIIAEAKLAEEEKGDKKL